MVVEESKVEKTTVVTDIICDSCGNSCKTEFDNFEHMTLEAQWGYESKYDMEKHTAQICEKCYNEKLKPLIKFKITQLHIKSSIV